MMRILSVTAQKPDSTGSGVYLTELVKGFQKLGHEQAVLAGITKEDEVQLPERIGFYPVYYQTEKMPFPIAGMSDEMPYVSTKYSNMTEKMTEQFASTFLEQIQNVMEEFQPDIVLCHHLYFLTALIRKHYPKQKIFAISHGSDLRQIKKNPWRREFIKEQILQLDGIFALHEEQKKTICEYFACSDSKVRVVGAGYNSDVFFVQDVKKDDEVLKLIFAGKISEKKGVMSLIRSMEYLQGEKISLSLAGGAGNVQEFSQIKELARNCSCKVEFLGKLSQRELAQRINQSDILVLPSFYEGLPLVVIEAMACGAKVVCTDLPGIQGWLAQRLPGNEVVFVVPPQMQNEDEPVEESLEEFEKRLAEAILQAKEKNAIAQELIEKNSWGGLCRQMTEVFLSDAASL